MVIQEKFTSALSFSKNHRKEITALGIALAVTATSCREIENRNFNSMSQSTPYATPTTTPEPKIDGYKLVPNDQSGCPNDSIGIRNDHEEMMGIIKKLCLGRVRTAIDIYTWNVKTEEAIKKAHDLGYKVLGTLVTHGPNLNETELITKLASKYPKMIFEIGNEIDNPPFAIPDDSSLLKDIPKEQKDEKRLQIFADDFAEKYFKIKRLNPNAQIILGATVDPAKTVRILELLEERGIKRENLYAAIHVYHTIDDIRDRIDFLIKNGVSIKKIIITELGSDTKDKKVIIRMIKYARERGIEIIYIHELPYFEGYGCPMVKNGNNEFDLKDETCKPIKDHAIEEIKNKPLGRYRLPSSKVNQIYVNNTQRRYDHRRVA